MQRLERDNLEKKEVQRALHKIGRFAHGFTLGYRDQNTTAPLGKQGESSMEGSTLTLGQVLERTRRRAPLKPITIRTHRQDIRAARRLASVKGIGYQTYIKLLLREALERETRKLSINRGRR